MKKQGGKIEMISHITLEVGRENWRKERTLGNALFFVAWFLMFGWHIHWLEKFVNWTNKVKI